MSVSDIIPLSKSNPRYNILTLTPKETVKGRWIEKISTIQSKSHHVSRELYRIIIIIKSIYIAQSR